MNAKYQQDLYAWSKEQFIFLMQKQTAYIDFTNIAEEILSLGKSEKRALESYLVVWLKHEIKTKYQHEKATRSWQLSIKNAIAGCRKILRDNPSLKPELSNLIQDAYETARIEALIETNLDEREIPQVCYLSDKFIIEILSQDKRKIC